MNAPRPGSIRGGPGKRGRHLYAFENLTYGSCHWLDRSRVILETGADPRRVSIASHPSRRQGPTSRARRIAKAEAHRPAPAVNLDRRVNLSGDAAGVPVGDGLLGFLRRGRPGHRAAGDVV